MTSAGPRRSRRTVAGLARLAGVIILAAVAGACGARAPRTEADLPLAIAASESVTAALVDSIAPPRSYYAGPAIDSLTACEDRVDATGWESFSSGIVELQLPPDFESAGQISQRADWRGRDARISATSSSSALHSGWTGLITSECDVYVGGWPTHIDLVNTLYGKGVHATIQVQGAPAIALDGQARSIGRQAELLHAIRYARVSSSWGH